MSDIPEIPLLLFFIYDTERTQSEADDPLESIVYFHPSTGAGGLDADSLERRVGVVGQIVGTALCIRSLLSPPQLITLQLGKFALSWSGRFILVAGSSQPVPTQVIQNQRDFIHRLLSGRFGELADLFVALDCSDAEFKRVVGEFCDAHLTGITNKWAELATQPSLC